MKINDLYISERIEKNGYVNGIYVPWFHGNWYGRDIGTTSFDGKAGSCCFNEKYVRQIFYNCKIMGYEMVKIWLNESFEGMVFDDEGTVIGVEPLFLENLERTLQIAKEVGITLSFCVCAHHESSFAGNKLKYDKYSRFRQIPSETDKYIKNYLNPILELSHKYGVELFDIYAEPEADGGLWPITRGMSWDSMKRYINQVAKAIKDFDPRLATTVSSGSADNTILAGRYSDVDVDFYGCDIYNDAAAFADTKEMFLERYLMLGEYGVDHGVKKTDAERFEIIKKYYANFEKFGVAGGFYWAYGYPGINAQHHIINKDAELGKLAAYLHFRSVDLEKEPEKKDTPCIIMNTSTEKIMWFGARGATEYSLEYETEGDFTEIARVKQEEYEDVPDVLFASHEDSSDTENYRVTAFFSDGSTTVSPVLTLYKKVEI